MRLGLFVCFHELQRKIYKNVKEKLLTVNGGENNGMPKNITPMLNSDMRGGPRHKAIMKG